MPQTNFPSISGNAKVYVVTIGTTSTDMKLLDGTAQEWIIRNIGEWPIYLKYGTDCNSVVYTHRMNPNAIFCDNYGGLITGCVDNYRQTPGLVAITIKL